LSRVTGEAKIARYAAPTRSRAEVQVPGKSDKAFTVGISQVKTTVAYIENQKKHHAR
jgi:hypothetical protein